MSDATLTSTQNGSYSKGSSIQLNCYKRGQSVKGYYSPWISGGWDNLWYQVSDGYFVADVDINTGSNNPVTGACGSPAPAPVPVVIDTNAWFTLTARNSGQALDARGGSSANGTAVQQYPANNSSAQRWRFIATDSGYYRIASALNDNQVFDVNGGGSSNGSKVQLWGWGAGSANQQWMPIDSGSGYVSLRPRNVGRCLDVTGGSTSASVQLQIYDCNGTTSQQFLRTKAASVSSNSSIDAFVSKYNGRVGVTSVIPTAPLPGQCTSFMTRYVQEVWGYTMSTFGDARTWAGGTDSARLVAGGFSWHAGATDYRDGDLLVWSSNHVGVYYRGYVFDQNNATKDPVSGRQRGGDYYGTMGDVGYGQISRIAGYVGYWRHS